MKTIILFLSTVFATSALASGITQLDIEMAKQQAVQDLFLTEKIQAKESQLQNQTFSLFHSRPHHDPRCDDSGAGSKLCWEACRKEGYGSSTCASRCGTSTREGTKLCWDVCRQEGYGSSTCASRCGTSNREGITACWETCTKEGYGSSTCSSRCGVN